MSDSSTQILTPLQSNPTLSEQQNKTSIDAPLSIAGNREVRLGGQRLQSPSLSLIDGFQTTSTLLAADINADGNPDYIAPLEGRRTGPYLKELRDWRARNPDCSFETAANKVQECLIKHFGPYNSEIASALAKQAPIKEKLAEAYEDIERLRENPDYLAALEYRKRFGRTSQQQVAISGSAEAAAEYAVFQSKAMLERFNGAKAFLSECDSSFSTTSKESPTSESEAILTKRAQDLSDNIIASTENIIAKKQNEVSQLGKGVENITIPQIPGETFNPTNLDAIEYGKTVCRHRAPLAYLALKQMGFAAELALGDMKVGRVYTPHMFVDASSHGVYEPSSSSSTAVIVKKSGHEKDWRGKELPNVADTGTWVDYRYTKMTGNLIHPLVDRALMELKKLEPELAQQRIAAVEAYQIQHSINPGRAPEPEQYISTKELLEIAKKIAPPPILSAINCSRDDYIDTYQAPHMNADERELLQKARKAFGAYAESVKDLKRPEEPGAWQKIWSGYSDEYKAASSKCDQAARDLSDLRSKIDNVVELYENRRSRGYQVEQIKLLDEYCLKTGLFIPPVKDSNTSSPLQTENGPSISSFYKLAREECRLIVKQAAASN